MGRYILRRVLQAIPLLFFLTIFIFALIHLLPGGPDAVLFNPHITAQARANLRASMGLDDPVPVQYLKWLTSALTGNFGFSFNTNEAVSTVIGRAFPLTLQLFGAALVLALFIAILLGVIAGVRQGSATDYTLTVLADWLDLPGYFRRSAPLVPYLRYRNRERNLHQQFRSHLRPLMVPGLAHVGAVHRLHRRLESLPALEHD
jgi:ABC-type dipeptide/oligopeptide/nickel transport system permease component